ncbi:nitrile hydratase subunit alpha [Streptomyces sp. VRA16 Mangrove soil]|uniref:nitrile hydratase subunit alpha n=1 Tax=Streptomyces sp. VRA16 Mangrove soil TaxID=2817434 RepID=UPI001A9DF63C|nr:nitrile hydratase subunit alpha [Streptomyces sp. VRA16 Mangrove soil]MBO1337747.1 nitrile hydratase subunit alpha [Streptomyces sp. VRA16 Mangrove soil]
MSGDHDDAVISRQVRLLETLLEQKGIVGGDTVDEVIDGFLSGASPLNGAKAVARAWIDPEFKERLLADGTAAVTELGFTGQAGQRLRVVENTDAVHNMIVCTLCSCYPLRLLGPSPGWYKSEAYRSRVVREPRAVLSEFGVTLPDAVRVTVWDSSSDTRYMVLPRRPAGTGSLGEPELATLVTRNGLIGTAAV